MSPGTNDCLLVGIALDAGGCKIIPASIAFAVDREVAKRMQERFWELSDYVRQTNYHVLFRLPSRLLVHEQST